MTLNRLASSPSLQPQNGWISAHAILIRPLIVCTAQEVRTRLQLSCLWGFLTFSIALVPFP